MYILRESGVENIHIHLTNELIQLTFEINKLNNIRSCQVKRADSLYNIPLNVCYIIHIKKNR